MVQCQVGLTGQVRITTAHSENAFCLAPGSMATAPMKNRDSLKVKSAVKFHFKLFTMNNTVSCELISWAKEGVDQTITIPRGVVLYWGQCKRASSGSITKITYATYVAVLWALSGSELRGNFFC